VVGAGVVGCLVVRLDGELDGDALEVEVGDRVVGYSVGCLDG